MTEKPSERGFAHPTFLPPTHTLHCSCQLTLVLQEEPDSIFNSLQCMLPDGLIIAAPSSSILTSLSCSPPTLSLIQPPSTLAFEAGLPLHIDHPILFSPFIVSHPTPLH